MEKKSHERRKAAGAAKPRLSRLKKLGVFFLVSALLIAAGAIAWRLYIADRIRDYLISLAEQSINGRIEFDSISINVFTGKAGVKGLRIFLPDEDGPAVRIADADIDAFALRGKKVEMNVKDALVSLVREKDGSINLLGLYKPPPEKKKPEWDISISLSSIAVVFTDKCGVPDADLARLRESDGLLKFESALESFGVTPAADNSGRDFLFETSLTRIGGMFRSYAATEESEVNLKGFHGDTPFSAGYKSNSATGRASGNLVWNEEDFSTIAPYAEQVSPYIPPLEIGMKMRGLSASYARNAAGETGVNISGAIENASATAGNLPKIEIAGLGFEFDSGSGELRIKNFDARYGDARLGAAGLIAIKEGTLDLSAQIADLSLETLPEKPPAGGVLSADLKIGGELGRPALSGLATLEKSSYENVRLGTLRAKFNASGDGTVNLESVSIAGGDLAASASGVVSADGSANLSFSIPPTSVSTFARLAETEIPASGRVSLAGNLEYSKAGGVRVNGRASSSSLETGNAVLDAVSAGFSYDGRGATIRNLNFAYDTGGGVKVHTIADVESRNGAGGKTALKIRGKSTFAGLRPFEISGPSRPVTDIVGLLPMPDESGLFYDPNSPKRGTVVYSTDPSRIGLEVWWPRIEESEAESAETSGNGGEARYEPSAPNPGWLTHAVLSAAAPTGSALTTAQPLHPGMSFDIEANIAQSGAKEHSISAAGNMSLDGIFHRPVSIELTAEGTPGEVRIYATAAGRYKMRGFTARAGYGLKTGERHDYDVHLLYGNSDFTLKGSLDAKTGGIGASVKSEAIQLEDLLDLEGIYGTSVLAGEISGTLSDPRLEGSLEIESAEYTPDAPPYPTFEIREASIPFAYRSRAIHIAKGKMKFGESELTLSGLVSEGEMSVRLASSGFSLGDIAGVVAPEVRIEGGGDLSARLSGTLHEPDYALDFTQSEGSVNGIPFTDAILSVSGDLEVLHLTELRVGSEGGSVKASGDLTLDEEHKVRALFELEKFQIGLITPLFMGRGETALRGLVDGSAEIGGTIKSAISDVSIELSEGKILDQEIEGILEFTTSADEIRLTAFEASAGDSTVIMEGVIRDNIAQSELSIDIPYLDLALINPFLNLTGEDGFWGNISGGTIARRGERGTYMSGYLSGSGGLGFGIIALAGVSGNFNIYPDALELREFKFTTEDSVLEADGNLPIKLLSPEARRAIEEGTLRDLPAGLAGGARRAPAPHEAPESERFNLNLRAENFQLDYITEIFPDTGIEVGGTITADLAVGGTPEFPVADGAVEFAMRDFDYQGAFSVGSVDGKINVVYEPDLVAQAFWLENFVIGEPEAGAEQESPRRRRTDGGGEEKAVHNITLDGGGTFRLMPFSLFDMEITGTLNNFDRFQLSNVYRGPIAGEFTLQKDISDSNIHVGGSVTLRRGGTFTLHAPDASARPPASLPVTFGTYAPIGSDAPGAIPPPQTGGRFTARPLSPFKVFIEQGVNVRFPPIVDLRAEIQSAVDERGNVSPLLIQGDFPNMSISGRLQSYKGSLIVLRHTFRVVDPPFEIRFDPMWGMVPYLRGRAAVVISQRSESSLAGFDAFSDDLTVFVNLDSLATELDEITMTSDTPLSQEEIARRMLGVLPPEGSVQGLTPEIREELYKVVGARVGRILEDKLNLDQFLLTIGDDNEFYIDLEKELTDRLSVLYSTELFGGGDGEGREQFGLRYLFLKRRLMRAYIEALYDNSDSKFQGNEIRVILRRRY